MVLKVIKKHQGFSLLEILIATALGLWLLAIVMQNYLLGKNIYGKAEDLAVLSENIRFADFVLWQNITQAGFSGCKRLTELNVSNHLSSKLMEIKNIRGYSYRQAPKSLSSKVILGNDIIVISKVATEVWYLTVDIKKGTKSFDIDQKINSKRNRWLMISDCVNADLFEINKHHSKTIRFNTPLQHQYKKKNTEVRFFEEIAFFISNTGRKDNKNNPILGLYFSINGGNKSEIISNVSDMKVYYGIDLNNQGTIDKYYSAAEVSDIKLWDKVLSVVITLTFHSGYFSRQKSLYIKLRGRE